MWHVWRRGEFHSGLWCGDLMEGDHLEDLGVDGRITLKLVSKKWDAEAWTGQLWHRKETGGGRL